MTKAAKTAGRKQRRDRRAKKAKLAIQIVHRLIHKEPTTKEIERFKKLFVVDAIVTPVKGGK